jgi:hypothetical protein
VVLLETLGPVALASGARVGTRAGRTAGEGKRAAGQERHGRTRGAAAGRARLLVNGRDAQLATSELEAVHRRERRLGGLDVKVPATRTTLAAGSAGRQRRALGKTPKANALDKAEALALAGEGLPVEVDKLDLAKRRKDLLEVLGGEVKVQRADVQPVVGDLGPGEAVAMERATGRGCSSLDRTRGKRGRRRTHLQRGEGARTGSANATEQKSAQSSVRLSRWTPGRRTHP